MSVDSTIVGVHQHGVGPGWRRWLLAHRSLTRNAKSGLEIAYYLCGASIGTSDAELIRVARARWSVCFQTAKTEVGLDQYQVRRYDAWYRHITLAMLEHTYLAVTAIISPKALAAASFHPHPVKSSVSWRT
uniref:hypothetical protein n=1 Tax=Nocardia vulneris TaxID=1141657 RepID=UPI0009E4ED94